LARDAVIPFLDLGAIHGGMRSEILAAMERVLDSGRFILGEEVTAFEQEFARYTGTTYCLGVANGLDALELALRAAAIGPGDEVIVPGNTFIATWLAVSRVGAQVVPVEPLLDTYNIDPDAVGAAISRRTRAVIAVHLYGQPADMRGLRSVIAGRPILLIEDAAQAHGARLSGERVGGIGDVAAWSFYPGKNLGALGDGGAVTTNDGRIAEAVRRLRNYGSTEKYVHPSRGFNSRLDELQAAVLRVKLRHLDSWNAHRCEVAGLYLRLLATSPVALPTTPEWAAPVWHLFVIRTPSREVVMARLHDAGIQTQVHYPIPPHLQGAYAMESFGPLPLTESIHREVLSLPIGPSLLLADAERVAAVVREATAT